MLSSPILLGVWKVYGTKQHFLGPGDKGLQFTPTRYKIPNDTGSICTKVGSGYGGIESTTIHQPPFLLQSLIIGG